MIRSGTKILLGAVLAAACLALPASASAVMNGIVEDPLEGTAFVPDLGRTSIALTPDGQLVVETRIVARPPAGWGGCVPLPSGTCLPAQMSVSWLFDNQPDGSPTEGGADAKVVATPAQGVTTWQSLRWDRGGGRWIAGIVPAGATDITGARWSLDALELGLRPTGASSPTAGSSPSTASTATMRIVSRFRALGEDGVPVETSDEAGPLTFSLDGLAPSAAAPATPQSDAARRGTAARPHVSAVCRTARQRLTTLDRRIAKLRRIATTRARGRDAAARRVSARGELRRLRPQRAKARAHERHACARASQPRSH
jgi:hypothetical protein